MASEVNTRTVSVAGGRRKGTCLFLPERISNVHHVSQPIYPISLSPGQGDQRGGPSVGPGSGLAGGVGQVVLPSTPPSTRVGRATRSTYTSPSPNRSKNSRAASGR